MRGQQSVLPSGQALGQATIARVSGSRLTVNSRTLMVPRSVSSCQAPLRCRASMAPVLSLSRKPSGPVTSVPESR